jgi:crossover junction endodeoxyribonuclease RuvC
VKITGLDLSLRDTGVAVIRTGNGQLPTVSVSRVRPGDKRTGHPRLKYLYTEVRQRAYGSDLIVVEGPAFAQGTIQHTMGGCWWIILHVVWLDNPDAEVVIVRPQELKQFATGRMKADKDEVMAAAINRYRDHVTLTNNNEADALILGAMGAYQKGFPLATVPLDHAKALANWPYRKGKDA